MDGRTLCFKYLDNYTMFQVYSQLFVRVNGKVLPSAMLIVKEGEVAHSDFIVSLEAGDTLDLYAGHVTTKKRTRDAYGGDHMFIEGGNLEDVVFCVISDRF